MTGVQIPVGALDLRANDLKRRYCPYFLWSHGEHELVLQAEVSDVDFDLSLIGEDTADSYTYATYIPEDATVYLNALYYRLKVREHQ